MLVAGCGEGHEAAFIQEQLGGEVDAIDLAPPGAAAPPGCRYRRASVLAPPFPPEVFDAIFYHHVIEHVGGVEAARTSLRRLWALLRPGGLIYVGTPNRHRLVGYVGSFDATRREKVAWNLADYRARLRGRFTNDDGAHAGFSRRELRDMLRAAGFRGYRDLTADYLRFKYASLPGVGLGAATTLAEIAAPSIYAVATRPEEARGQ